MLELNKQNLKKIPSKPGVYMFADKKNIIYIGKAKNLKKRISQYFASKHQYSVKTQLLVKNINSLDYIIVDNEVEALLLENKLIKKHAPKYNINLKDSKTYPYIKITDEPIPKIQFTRLVTKKGTYFGPFTNGEIRRELFFLTTKLFKLITKQTYSSKSQLNYEIGLAPAKNIKDINKKEYLEQVELAKKFLAGNTKIIENKLRKEMKKASEMLQFELANEKKQQLLTIEHLKEKQKVDLLKNYNQDVIIVIENKEEHKILIHILKIKKGVISSKKEYKFNYIDKNLLEEFIKIYYSQNSIPKEIILEKDVFNSPQDKLLIEKYLSKLRLAKTIISIPKKGEKLNLIKLAKKNALQNFAQDDMSIQLKNKLNLPKIPNVIDCFDVSNLGSEHIVAGMVQFENSLPNKKNFRRFEIKSFRNKNDDFAAISEVVYRRYSRLKKEQKQMPDLIIIDGGKGQLSSAVNSLKSLSLRISIISLAKKEEEIFVLGKKEPFKFDKNSQMMLYLRKIRDSAHNYVISYNRKKREMKLKRELKN